MPPLRSILIQRQKHAEIIWINKFRQFSLFFGFQTIIHIPIPGTSISWKHIFNSSLTLDLSSAYSQYNNDYSEKSNETTAFTHKYSIESIESRADFRFLSKNNHQMLFGLNSTYYTNKRGEILPSRTRFKRASEKPWK